MALPSLSEYQARRKYRRSLKGLSAEKLRKRLAGTPDSGFAPSPNQANALQRAITRRETSSFKPKQRDFLKDYNQDRAKMIRLTDKLGGGQTAQEPGLLERQVALQKRLDARKGKAQGILGSRYGNGKMSGSGNGGSTGLPSVGGTAVTPSVGGTSRRQRGFVGGGSTSPTTGPTAGATAYKKRKKRSFFS